MMERTDLAPGEGAVYARRPLWAAILLLMAAALGWRFLEAEGFRVLAGGVMGVVMILTIPRFGAREWYLGALSLLAALLLFYLEPAPLRFFLAGFDQAAFLMAFIFLLSLIHEAASSSPAIAACGGYLTSQPPGRRYGALFWGSNIMGVLFNLGVVSLLTPLVKRGLETRALPPPLRAISERRQINALLHGFSWNVIWSPTALAPLAVYELIAGIDRALWSALGFGIVLLMFALGWAEDRATARRLLAGRTALGGAPPFPGRAFLGFAGVVAVLFTAMEGVALTTGETMVAGLMLSCPALMVGWLMIQARGRVHEAAGRAGHIIGYRLPRLAPVAVTLAFSGFLGRIGAALTPAEAIAEVVGIYVAPDFLLLGLLPVVIGGLSFLGVSPIMLAVFFGSLFGGLEVLPADPTLIALSISCGWALAMLVSPFATVVILLADATGRSGLDIAFRRNRLYAVLVVLLFTPIFLVLTGG